MKKTDKKYYLLYLISVLVLMFIWLRPVMFQKKQDGQISEIDKILETDVKITTKSLYQVEEAPKTDQIISKEWFFVSKLNQIISLVVGLVNFYFIFVHIRKKLQRKNR